MATGMWTSVSGAAAQSQAVDIVANNLANSDTLAFKKDLPAFREYVAAAERQHHAQDVPRGPVKDKDFYPIDGRDQSFVVTDGTYTNFRQGNLRVTQAPLDVAMDGPGFVEVSTPAGIRFTRQGSFKVSTNGKLVTSEGYPVLSAQAGAPGNALPNSAQRALAAAPSGALGVAPGAVGTAQPPAARLIDLKDRTHRLSISDAGEIYDGDELVAKLSVVEFKDTNKLRKTGSSLFDNSDATNLQTGPLRTLVRQGVLETSNVNPVEEMTNLIKANRLFEQDMKAIKTYNDLLGREVNDIGKL